MSSPAVSDLQRMLGPFRDTRLPVAILEDEQERSVAHLRLRRAARVLQRWFRQRYYAPDGKGGQLAIQRLQQIGAVVTLYAPPSFRMVESGHHFIGTYEFQHCFALRCSGPLPEHESAQGRTQMWINLANPTQVFYR